MSTFIRKQDNFYSMTGRRFRFHPPRALPNASPRRRRWISLPPEIRLLILESIVIQSTNSDATTSDGVQGPRIAPCASVCHEWQCFFERLTFKRLALDYISLPKFAAAVKGKNIARLKYIRHLWLRVKLCNYTDQTYYKAEDGSTIARNNLIFTACITYLLKILSTWTPRDDPGGLTLEISAHSPSDGKYRFHLFELEDDYPFHDEDDLKRTPDLREYHWLKYMEILGNGRSFHPRSPLGQIRASPGELQRVEGTPLELRPSKLIDKRGRPNPIPSLPEAPIVKALLIRRPYFRHIAPTTLARLFQQSLVAVESFRLERWSSATRECEVAFIRDFLEHVVPALPRSLKRFGFDQQRIWKKSPSMTRVFNEYYEPLSQALANCSHLTEFSPGPYVIAEVFLRKLDPRHNKDAPDWSRLERLCLHNRLFDPAMKSKYLSRVLVAAAKAAKHMPRLRVMEIWNAKLDFGYLFRYTFDGSQATITWRSVGPNILGHELHPNSNSMRRWREVVSKLSHRDISVEMDPFRESFKEISESHGTFLHKHLMLRKLAFDPVSEEQLIAEISLGHEFYPI